MHAVADKSKTVQPVRSAGSAQAGHVHAGQSRETDSPFQIQRSTWSQAGRQWLDATAGIAATDSPAAGISRASHDSGWTTAPARITGVVQAKLTINEPGDQYEQEADRVSEQVMRMEAFDIGSNTPPSIQRLSVGYRSKISPKFLQRLCAECEKESVQRKSDPAYSDHALQSAEVKVNAVSGGQPLTQVQRAFFEPRFGADFSNVRIHTGSTADTAARSVGARAYTRGSDIVFRQSEYRPDDSAGRQLIAHELTHVVQQGAAERVQRQPMHEESGGHQEQNLHGVLHIGGLGDMLQRWPGDGMTPPGDCSWLEYGALRLSVESAKAVVNMLGGCSQGDSCLFLATKIAAIAAEIAARLALDSTCFKGGDTGHREQVQIKVNMLKNCYKFFDNSNCPQELVAAMAVVVQRAREVIEAAAVLVAVALIVALIVAIIALAEVIAALLAAAAEAAAATTAVAAVIALLIVLRDELAPSN